ncbi:leukocyte surface antigen CD53-like [Syngnathus typhle]
MRFSAIILRYIKVNSNPEWDCHICNIRCCFLSVLQLCGAFVVAFGIFQSIHSKFASLVTTFWPILPANTLVVTGTIVTCVCYLGVLGAMKENRWLLISGCLIKLRDWFAGNYRSTGAGVVTLFIIQFLCLCFTIPLFCHFGRNGLGYL